MATIKRFEDLEVWQLSRNLNKELFEILKSKPQNTNGYLVNNVYKTAGSIMDNIAEGFERDGNKEFKQFLSISKGSSGEFKSQLYRAFDFNIITEKEFKTLFNKTHSVAKQLNSLMNYLKKSNYSGRKFSEGHEEYVTNDKKT